MKRLCTFLVLLASACAYGQVGPVSITSAECATIGVGAKVSVITFQVTGTWTGTLQPKITVQGNAAANVQVTPSTSSTAASTVTANGIYTAQVNGADTFQVCGNTVASGTANVYLNTSVASKGGGSSGGGGSGTVTSVATTSPIGGGTITSTGTVTCTTCVVASSPGVGLAHFAGSTQTATSSAVVAADITSGTITGTQLSSSIALPNGATATTQSASDNSTKVATTAYVDRAAPAMVQLETHTAASSATLDLTTCFTSTYHRYLIAYNNLIPATNSVQLQALYSTNGGSTWDTTSGHYAWSFLNILSAATGFGGSTSDTKLGLSDASSPVSSTANLGGISASLTIYDPLAAHYVQMAGESIHVLSGTNPSGVDVVGGNYTVTTGAVNAMRVQFSSGNIASGVITCYGITP